MGRAKLKRFKEIEHRFNVLQEGHALYENIKGQWREKFFKNKQPIVLELACGKGHYTTGLAMRNPNKNFIGIDIKGDRLCIGSTCSIENELTNTAFLRAQIQQLTHFFATDEVDEIWITFPDPRPKDRDIKRRLTSPRYLNMYQDILKSHGEVRLKTDNEMLFNYTLALLNERQDTKVLRSTNDLYQSSLLNEHHTIQTEFEMKFLKKNIPIKYLVFKFKS